MDRSHHLCQEHTDSASLNFNMYKDVYVFEKVSTDSRVYVRFS